MKTISLAPSALDAAQIDPLALFAVIAVIGAVKLAWDAIS